MAINKTINIPNLVPGKRYRMVVEPNVQNNEDWSNISVPSIEFLVPSSPNLLSSYTPVVERSFDRSSNSYEAPISAVNKSISITGWNRTKGSYTYEFYIDGDTTGLVPGRLFKVNGMSSPPHEYYDRLAYSVSSLSGSTLVCTASYDTTKVLTGHTNLSSMSSVFCHTNHYPSSVSKKAYKTDTSLQWDYNDGRSLTTAKTGRDGTGYWIIPASSYTVPGVRVLDVKMTIPSNITLHNTKTVIDLPYFFYTSGGSYFNLNGTTFDGSIPSMSSEPTRNLRTSGWVQGLPDPNGVKNYKFSIARYVKNGTSWVGDWLQRDQALALSANSIVYSKEVTL